eukprot:6341779-Amphidinium_carterae.1
MHFLDSLRGPRLLKYHRGHGYYQINSLSILSGTATEIENIPLEVYLGNGDASTFKKAGHCKGTEKHMATKANQACELPYPSMAPDPQSKDGHQRLFIRNASELF